MAGLRRVHFQSSEELQLVDEARTVQYAKPWNLRSCRSYSRSQRVTV